MSETNSLAPANEHNMPSAEPAGIAAPLYGARMGQALQRFFRKYTMFHGRASRSEYWWVALALAVVSLIAYAILVSGVVIGGTWAANNKHAEYYDYGNGSRTLIGYTQPGIIEHPPAATLIIIGFAALAVLFLVTVVPTLALTWRRLHDANFPGPFVFLSLIPGIGSIILLVLAIQPSKAEGRRFDR